MNDQRACQAFVLAHTRRQRPLHVPELELHLADEAVELWRMTERDLDASGLPLPFWAFAWAGGQAVARHILDHPDLVAGKSVLCFAAGSGMEAVAAVKAGAARVLASDIDCYARAAMAVNAAANGVTFAITGDDLLRVPAPPVDVILIGDLFYEKPLADAVAAWGLAAHRAGIAVIAGDPGRSYLPRTHLRDLAHHSVPTSRALEDADVKHTTVWQFVDD